MAETTVVFTVNAQPETSNIVITYSGVVQDYEWTEKTISSGQFVRVVPGATIHYKISAPGYYTIEDDIVVTSDLDLEFVLNPITVSEYSYTLKAVPSDAYITLYKINDDETLTPLFEDTVGEVSVILPRYTRLTYTVYSNELTYIGYDEYVIMPRASSVYADQTVKYIGETTSTYTQNSYYKCELNEDGYTYSWVVDSSADPSPQQKYATSTGTLMLTEARVDTIELQEFGWVKLSVRPHPENAAVTFAYTKTEGAEVTPVIVNNNVEHSIYYSPTEVSAISYTTTLAGYTGYKNTTGSWVSPNIPTSNQVIDAYFSYTISSAVLLNTNVPGDYVVTIPESYPGIYIKQLYLVGAGGGGAVWWSHTSRRWLEDFSHSGIGGGAAGALLQGSSVHSSMTGTYHIIVGSGGGTYRVNADWAYGGGTAGSGSLIIKDNQTLCVANGGAGGYTGSTVAGGSYEVYTDKLSLVGVKGENGHGQVFNASSEAGWYERINQVGATSAYPPYGNGGQSGCSDVSTERGQNGYAYFEIASIISSE